LLLNRRCRLEARGHFSDAGGLSEVHGPDRGI